MGSKLKKHWLYEAEWFDRRGALSARRMVAVVTDTGASAQRAGALARRTAMDLASLEVRSGRWRVSGWTLRVRQTRGPVLVEAEGGVGQCGS